MPSCSCMGCSSDIALLSQNDVHNTYITEKLALLLLKHALFKLIELELLAHFDVVHRLLHCTIKSFFARQKVLVFQTKHWVVRNQLVCAGIIAL